MLDALSLLLASHAAFADDTQLSAVSVNRGKALRTHVGVIVKESPQLILNDLVTGKQLTFKKSEIRQIRRDIGKDAAARAIGVAPLVAWKLVDLLPEETKSGKIASVDGRAVYVTYGKKSGIKSGDKLNVYRIGKVIRDPDTGDVLGQERRKVGSLLVSEVSEKYSKALHATDLEIEFKPGDLVTPESTKNAIAIFPLVDQRSLITKGGVQIAEELTSSLVNRGVSVVERVRLRDALRELKLQQANAFNEKTVQKVGDLLGAFAIVTGSITNDRTRSKVNIKVIETGTGKVLFAETYKVGKLNALPATLFRPTSYSPYLPKGVIRRFVGHTQPVGCVAFSRDGKYALSGGVDKVIRLWNVKTGVEVQHFKGHKNIVYCVAFSHDGKTVVSSSRDWTIRIWDVATGKQRHKIDVRAEVPAVVYLQNGRQVVSGARYGKEGFIQIWNIKSQREVSRFKSSAQIWTVDVSPDGKVLASGDSAGRIEVRDLKTGKVRRVVTHSTLVTSVKFMPDGHSLIARSTDGKIRQWDLSSGNIIQEMLGSKGVGKLSISPDGQYCLSTGKETLLWDLPSATLLDRVQGDTVSDVSFGPHGQFALISVGKTVQLWKLSSLGAP